MNAGTSVPVTKTDDTDGWYCYADSNVPIVTQWDDGKHTGTKPGNFSTSSSSMPSANATCPVVATVTAASAASNMTKETAIRRT
ncbi:hypothetical protein [Streptomyces sp. KR80]|uniref:hypothetical protein n=1 Tax=Streptomyces sp. KR80 TaxID=3457426 RepID=UPI003FD272DA